MGAKPPLPGGFSRDVAHPLVTPDRKSGVCAGSLPGADWNVHVHHTLARGASRIDVDPASLRE